MSHKHVDITNAAYELSGRVKITRACRSCLNGPGRASCHVCGGSGQRGVVEFADLPQNGLEMYLQPDGSLAPTYPEGYLPGVVVDGGLTPRRLALMAVGAGALYLACRYASPLFHLGAIVYTDKGQELTVDVIDPATRGSQVTTYYGAWGSGSTAPAVGNTALGTELAEARVATTITQPAANTIQWLWEVTATGNRTVNEFGVFTASSAGNMWIRGTLSTLNIETGDRVEFTIQLLFKDVSE